MNLITILLTALLLAPLTALHAADALRQNPNILFIVESTGEFLYTVRSQTCPSNLAPMLPTNTRPKSARTSRTPW